MPCFRHCFPGIKRDLKEKNYSRLSIISDFHYPCKKIGHAERTPALYGCQRRGPAGYERLARPRSGRLYGRYVQRNGDAEEYRLVRLVVNGLKKRKAFIAGNHELLYTGHGEDLRPCSSTERILHFARYTKTSGRCITPKNSGGISWSSCRRTRLPAALPSNYPISS